MDFRVEFSDIEIQYRKDTSFWPPNQAEGKLSLVVPADYVILRLVGPTGIGATFGLSRWTGTVAEWAAKRRQNKRKLV